MTFYQNSIVLSLIITFILTLYNFLDDLFNNKEEERSKYFRSFIILGVIMYFILPKTIQNGVNSPPLMGQQFTVGPSPF